LQKLTQMALEILELGVQCVSGRQQAARLMRENKPNANGAKERSFTNASAALKGSTSGALHGCQAKSGLAQSMARN
jgi:hypothetical protein